MIAGGTGITPMLQVIKEIIKNPLDQTEVHLLFSNHAEEDILLENELNEIAAKHKNIKVTYILSSPAAPHWTGLKGRVTLPLIEQCMPKPANDISIYVCGPPGFMDTVSGNKTKDFKQGEVTGILKQLGFDETMVFKF
jgi:cytochrome-b5 reductase